MLEILLDSSLLRRWVFLQHTSHTTLLLGAFAMQDLVVGGVASVVFGFEGYGAHFGEKRADFLVGMGFGEFWEEGNRQLGIVRPPLVGSS